MSERVLDVWVRALATWIEAELPAEFPAEFEVSTGMSGNSRPCPGLVVRPRGSEEVRQMAYTAMVRGGVFLRTNLDDTLLERHREWCGKIDVLLRQMERKPGPLDGVYVHDRWVEDALDGEDDGERVTGWPVRALVTLTG